MEVTAPKAIRLLLWPRTLRMLELLMQREQSISQLSHALQLPLNTVWRRVDALCSQKLVKVVRQQKRAGRGIKKYAAASNRYFVPFDAEPDSLPEDVIRRAVTLRVEGQVRGLLRAATVTASRHASRRWGTLLYIDRGGSLVVRPDFEGGRTPDFLDSRMPAYLNFHSDGLRLSPAQAKQLQRELIQLLKRYKRGDAHRRYSLSIVLTRAFH
jgi:hypothetical protein